MTHQRLATPVAAALGLLGWFALALQAYLTLANGLDKGWTLGRSLIFFASFFTVTTNALAALVLTAPIVVPRSTLGRWLGRPRVRGALATYMAVVGLVYTLALRQVWDPQGPQLVADRLLHDVMPVLYVAFWLGLVEKGETRWRDVVAWLGYPVLYMAYSLVRGAVVGWYPYPFVDVTVLGYPRALVHAGVVLCAFAVVGLIVIAVDRALARARTRGAGTDPG